MAGKSVPKVKQKLDKKDLTLSLAFLLPAILITVIFVIYPVFDTVGLSFRKWNGMFGAAKQWVGLENYQKIFSDKLFWNAMLNSVYFMIGGFVILMPLSFGLAMLVTTKIKGTGFFRTCYFLPNMLGTTAVALMWTFMLNPNFGIFNTIENIFGLHGAIPDVLTIKTVNVWIVILVNEWMYAGYNMLIFAAGLVAIPDELNEAAALDGATGCILHDRSNGSGPLYTDPDQQHCNSIKCKEQPVLPDPDLCCVWYVPGDIPLYRIHGWNLQEPG